MIDKMHGFKVLRTDRMSCGFHNCRLSYPVNTTVFPILKGSKLFFFRTKEDAEYFVSLRDLSPSGYLIVPCIAHNCKKLKRISYGNEIDITTFWRKHLLKKSTKEYVFAPKDTWVADSITCLE